MSLALRHPAEDPKLDETTLDEIPKSGHPSIILHEGSEPKLATETQKLLRSRLRASALLLSLGFFLFLVRNSILCDYSDQVAVSLLVFHGMVTFVLAIAGGLLSWKTEISMRKLRLVEIIIFGVPVFYFLTMQSIGLLEEREGFGPLGNSYSGAFQGEILPVWYILMLTYAFFIPSSVRRTAIVTGTMAIAPVIVLVVLRDQFASVARGLRFEYMTGQALLLAITAIACVVGSHIIHTLRYEAFEAKQLGQYRLRHLIGAGGMGKVYLAEHQMMKRPCAIKLIHPAKAGDPKTLARFEREVQATANLSHFNTIEIFDYGHTKDGTFFYVMEYLPGMNLHELVKGFGPLPAQRVIHFLVQTCNALREAHEMGLIHRDIKPGNIFSAYRGGTYDVVKLLDFGLVKPVVETKAARLTMEGTITGSPNYLAPEQVMAESEPDARSDIYSLGTVAYYLLTGLSPFENDNPMKAMFAHVHEKVIPPSQIRPGIPKDLEAIILRCLEKAPVDRFSSAEALATALSKCEQAGQWTREDAARWWTEHHTRFESPKVEPKTVTHTGLDHQSDVLESVLPSS